jgi:L-2,4-diaminobutyrate decarboxylase
MSPVGTILESRVTRWLSDPAGLGPGAGGTFTSGGTEATFAALLAARAATLPNVWKEGVGAKAPVVLHGEHAHYAVARAVGELGLGTDPLSLRLREEYNRSGDRTLDRLAATGAILAHD